MVEKAPSARFLPSSIAKAQRQTGDSRQRDQQKQQVVEQQRRREERQADIAIVAFLNEAILDRLDAPEIDPARPELARENGRVFAQACQTLCSGIVAALGGVG